jgi:hypothetical protein
MLFDLGDIIPLSIEVKNAAGILSNAGAVSLTIGLPDGSVVTTTPSNPSPGRYEYDFPTSQAGRHSVRWVATGTNASAYADGFDVLPADVGYIVSLSAAKKHLNITNDVDDDELRDYIEAATKVVETYRNEAIVRRTIVERVDSVRGTSTLSQAGAAYDMGYETGGARRRITVSTTPVLSVTSVARVDGTYTWDMSQLDVDPDRGSITVLFGPLFYGFVEVTYVAGYPVVPANITLAAKIIIDHLWQLQRRPSLAGSSIFGAETDATPSGFGFAIPNRAAELLGGRPPVIA